MYLAIDIGGTKTRVAALDSSGVIKESHKFATPAEYPTFLKEIAATLLNFSAKKFTYACAGVPGRLERKQGIAVAFGNLPWRDIPIASDLQKIIHCPTIIENDANLAGLSEAMLLKNAFQKVLYVTISTGIGTGYIVDQKIDQGTQDSEGGHIILEYRGKLEPWEKFASGRAIFRRYGKKARDITDEYSWKQIARNIALGLSDLSVVLEPEVVVLGGGVSTYFDRFSLFLERYLQQFATPLAPLPVIRQAQRPNEAVIYGCYDLIKNQERHGSIH